jgi:hypothetical protein
MPFGCTGRVVRAGSGGSIIGTAERGCQHGLGKCAVINNIIAKKAPRGARIVMDTPVAARDSGQESDFGRTIPDERFLMNLAQET